MPRKADHTKGRSKYQRERILAALAIMPMTARDLSEKLHLHQDTINIHLRTMRDEKPATIHISDYRRNPKGGRRFAIYSIGNKGDTQFSRTREPKRHLLVKQNQEVIVKMLVEEPMTCSQIAAKIGYSASWVRVLLQRLRDAIPRRVHIHAWPHAENGVQPVYGAGNHPDAVRVPFTWAESAQRRRNKKKAWISTLTGATPTKLPLAGTGRIYNMDSPREAA